MCFALLLSDSGMLVMATDEDQSSGWQTIEDKKYYIDEVTGKAKTGWFLDDGLWYLFDSYGVMQTGWQSVGGNNYYLTETGQMASGWLYEENNWYYFGAANDGAMATGGRYVNGAVYVFNASGAMYANGTYTRNGCTFVADASGAVSSCYASNFPVVCQRPELPTGCEITALTMVMNYYGYPVSKVTMASNYLPTVKSGYYGVDLDYYFCGDPFTTNGMICGAGALVTAANGYFYDCGSKLRGIDLTGSSAMDVLARVAGGQPSVAMVTIGMAERRSASGWYTSTGKYVTYSTNDHGVAVIGWDSTTVTIVCPLFGVITYTRAQFENAYASRGNRAMILQ